MHSLRLLLITGLSLLIVAAFVIETSDAQPEYASCVLQCGNDFLLCWDKCAPGSSGASCVDDCVNS